MPLVRVRNTLLRVDGLLSTACCCDEDGPRCVSICCSGYLFSTVDCARDGVYSHTVTIPDGYSLPVPINITGGADDDVLIDGKSITTDLGLDPGPYWTYSGTSATCVGAHDIGSKAGPYSDPTNGGITFPMASEAFSVSLRDTVGGNAAFSIRICIDPNKTQRYHGNLKLAGGCDPGSPCNPLP